jgi:DNA-binding transcriptional LysR family regulator
MREPSTDPALDFKVILTEPFVAVLPAGHPLASLRRVPLGQLGDSQFTLLPRHAGPGLYDQIIGLCAEAGFMPDIAQHAVEWQTVCGLVAVGLGVSIAPASIRRVRLRGVAFRPIEPSAARTSVTAARRKDNRNPLIARLLESVNRDGLAGKSLETT